MLTAPRLRGLSAAVVVLAAVAGFPVDMLHAQGTISQKKPIGPFVVDVRASLPKVKATPAMAAAINVTTANLPGRGLGLALGAHWYPLRKGMLTLGVGGEWVASRARHSLDGATATAAPTVVTSRFSTLAPQISLNFGSQQGWSYISGGIGSSRFTVERQDAPLPPQLSRTKTINYGGGARWFSKTHVATSFDVRFYAVNPQDATAGRPALARMRMMALTVGVSLK
jgi:hypothetical protein